MKKQIIFNFTFVFFFVLNIKAQNTTFNNVAIGLDAPDWGVNVKTNFPGYTGGWGRGFFVSNETGGQHLLSVFAQGQSVNGVSTVTSSAIGKDFNEPYITFLPNGNVGIGTTNPSTKLESVGNEVISFEAAGFYNTRVYGNVNDRSETRINLGKIEGNIREPMGSIGAFPDDNRDSSNGSLVFYTRRSQSVIERLRINSNGYVGIGTTSISDILHLKSSNPVIRLEKEGVLNWRAGNVVGNNYTICPDSHNNTTFNITSRGDVGIGTITPDAKLTVAGNINSREVKVTVDAGADFVFEKEYNLPSLASLDTYIKENKHLPEIASAKEMQTNGINLSEMNIKLLQKMEEMTLYMIEQEKKNTLQSKEIDEQNKKIQTLIKENESFKTLSERFSKIENQLKTTK